MDNRSIFIAQVNEVKELVLEEIALSAAGNANRPVKQLKKMIAEIEMMEKAMSTDIFTPYYPHVIADSWDFNDRLGNALMDLAGVYAKL